MERYVCIHAHFYQPPRENPWLEAVEQQDSAYPYHDWNERITAECYSPNGASRVLDGGGRIVKITNNYARISFNFGPTLLSWMQQRAPQAYESVLEADRISRETFSGHGNAIAQAYNHMILPLANRRDKETQVRWGIRDFQHRFRRDPEGMWLPETAVDIESLEVLAEAGIRFTVLAPYQAQSVRRGGRLWQEVEGGKIDPTQAYMCQLPSGKSIALFFYDGPISRAVAFENLLSSGENFANRLVGGFDDARRWPQLMHIATDGETYGHHHAHGDMALAYALDYIESRKLARLTNYGEYLEKHPPTHEVQINQRTAWSCSHGVGRWETDCGCNSGGHAGWNQQWRGPLREALNWLRDELAQPFQEAARGLFNDPWATRDGYIGVVLDRTPANLEAFLSEQSGRDLNRLDTVRALKLLEMQRHLMLMFTSCGWFFDELTGIETVQVIQYAGRALQLAEELFGNHREECFLDLLAKAQSNISSFGTGRDLYGRYVKPASVNLLGVGAHYAIASLFQGFGAHDSIYCYRVDLKEHQLMEAGRARLAVGRAQICSGITREEMAVSFGVLHLGDHNVSAGVREFRDQENYDVLVKESTEAFSRADLPQALRVLDQHFGGAIYSLKSLFRDEQRRTVRRLLESTLREAEASYRQIYEHHAPLLHFMSDLHVPPPKVLVLTAEFVLNSALRRELMKPRIDVDRIRTLIETARNENIAWDTVALEYAWRHRVDELAVEFSRDSDNLELLQMLDQFVTLARTLPFEVNLWKVQNVYYYLAQTAYTQRGTRDDPESAEWKKSFAHLGEMLNVALPQPSEEPVAA